MYLVYSCVVYNWKVVLKNKINPFLTVAINNTVVFSCFPLKLEGPAL